MPTPIAVALSDFCRRAQAPASPKAVRDALSCLDPSEDEALKALADGEPAAKPLGPFAVLAVLRGLAPADAATRERAGDYRHVGASLPKFGAEPPAPVEPPAASPEPPAAPRASAAAPRREKKPRAAPAPKKLSRAERVAQRVRPQRRRPGDDAPNEPRPARLPASSFLPKRSLPAPRGRFTTVDTARQSFEALLKLSARETVESIAAQCATRFAVLDALDHSYAGRKSQPLQLADVEAVLERHGLLAALARREGEALLAHLKDQRGWLARSAGALGVSRRQLDSLVELLRLERPVAEIRQRFAREALAEANLAERLELLGKAKYLADLEIEEAFFPALKRDVERLLEPDAGQPLGVRLERAAKRHALPVEALRRAASRLELS